MNIKPILKENDWSTIIEVANKGKAQNYWKVGDEMNLVLYGKYNETVTLQIWDFNHFDKSDGSGKANICFGMKHLMKDKEFMNPFYFNTGGWNDSYMRNIIMKNIFNSMPTELRNGIKEVDTYANIGGESSSSSQGLLSKDKVFIPGVTEVGDKWDDQNQTETGQKKLPIFSNDSSRIKKLNNGNGLTEWWWTRSPYYIYDTCFCRFNADGVCGVNSADLSCGVCFCFNI